MNLAEELSRLAELRDRGVLTPKEFDRRKKQLLSGGRRSSRFVTIVAVFIAVMAIAGFAIKMIEAAPNSAIAGVGPTCEIPEVQTAVLKHLTDGNKAVYAANLHEQVTARSLADISEIYVNGETGFTACVAKVQYAGHEGTTGYTVTWVDRARGEFVVEFSRMDAILSQYRDVR